MTKNTKILYLCRLCTNFYILVLKKKIVTVGMSLDERKDLLSFAGYNLLVAIFKKNNGTLLTMNLFLHTVSLHLNVI